MTLGGVQANAVVVLAVGVGLLLLAVAARALRQRTIESRQSLARIDQRLTHVCAAVELLTETTESALRAAFAEIERLAAEQHAHTDPGALHTRVKKAARNGRTAREIAQTEGVSEGEIRLRLRMHGQDTAVPN